MTAQEIVAELRRMAMTLRIETTRYLANQPKKRWLERDADTLDAAALLIMERHDANQGGLHPTLEARPRGNGA